MVGVGGGAVARQFGQDRRPPAERRLPLLQDQDRGALPHHEPVAAGVEGTRRARGIVVAGREGLHGGKTGDSDAGDGGLAPSAHHGVHPPGPDEIESLPDRLG